jgi:segregation and condensation protein B
MDETDKNYRLLEAILFASADPLSTSALHERMPDGADVGGLLMTLKQAYSSRGINLVEIDGKWALRTAADLAEDLNVERHVQKKLSRAAMETLAIIAYHQPVTRAEIENVRGVSTHKGTLDTLMEMGWIKPGRRRETLGRPLTWVTAGAFLDQFSLDAITDLPGMDEMKASGLLDRRPAIETIHQDDLFTGQDGKEGVEEGDALGGLDGSAHEDDDEYYDDHEDGLEEMEGS